ncbi:MAG: uroporphyrinogen-III synthase [Pseudomonadota bacterium]
MTARLRVAVTRAEHDAAPFAARLEARGWTPVLEPLFSVRATRASVDDELAGAHAIAFTSANGVRVFAGLTLERALPVFAVGETTAAEARAAGFERVRVAGGDVDALAALLAAEAAPGASILHPSGAAVAGDLAGRLNDLGFEARRLPIYDAAPATAFSAGFVARLAASPPGLDWVTFFSPRTARIFLRLAEGAGVADRLGALGAACFSEAVAEAAGGSWRERRIAARPDQDALLDAMTPAP